MIRSILLNNEAHQSQSSTPLQPEQKMQASSLENGNRPPRPINTKSGSNSRASKDNPSAVSSDCNVKRGPDDRQVAKEPHNSGNVNEKQEKRMRNKDRPDRGVWAPLRRSDFSSSAGQASPLAPDSVKGTVSVPGCLFKYEEIIQKFSRLLAQLSFHIPGKEKKGKNKNKCQEMMNFSIK